MKVLYNAPNSRYNFPMKVKGNGQAKVLTTLELERLFSDGLISARDRTLFAICLFTGCRISEALSLQKTDIRNKTITFRKSTTKGKLKTRTIDTPYALVEYLDEYQPLVNLCCTNPIFRPCCGLDLESLCLRQIRRIKVKILRYNSHPLQNYQ